MRREMPLRLFKMVVFHNKVPKIIIIRRASEQLFYLPDAQLEEYLINYNEESEDLGNMKSTNSLRKRLAIEFGRSLIADKEYLRAKVNFYPLNSYKAGESLLAHSKPWQFHEMILISC